MFRDGDFFDDDSGETYSVVKALSDGGMGSTFIVEHTSTGVQYVAKTPLLVLRSNAKKWRTNSAF